MGSPAWLTLTLTLTITLSLSPTLSLTLSLTLNKVYRGITGMALPEKMRKHAADNTRGGIEFGFLSCSLEREVAHK